MTTLRIADSISMELRLFGLIGAFEYDKYHISFVASALYVSLMCSMGIQHAITIVNLETIDQLTESLYVLIIYVNACCKLFGLLRNRYKVAIIMDGLNEKLMLPSDWNHLYHEEFVRTMRHILMSARVFKCLVYVAILATVIATIFNQKLLFHCYFPFETRKAYSLQGYWMAYSYQMIYAVYLIQSNISMDIVTMAMLHCAAVKLKIMKYECEKLCTSWRCIDNLNAIKTAVIFHVDTVGYIGDIQTIFSFGIFVQCCLSVISICVIMLKAILLDISDTEQILRVVIVLMAFIFQVFYYCHYGNQIQHQSTKLFTSIYLCEWYKWHCNCFKNGQLNRDHTAAVKKGISILLERTKRSTIVTVGQFIELTYESFIMIIRTGYQYFAVLRDVLK